MKPDYAAILQDIGRRADHLVTMRLVAYVSEFDPRSTPQLSIRSIADICRCDRNTAMKAVEEGSAKGWLIRDQHKNSATFRLGSPGAETSEIFRQSDNEPYGENVGIIQTLSDELEPKSSEIFRHSTQNVGKIQTPVAATVGIIQTVPATTVRKIQTIEPGTPIDSRACDSPYPLPLIVSSHVGVSEESPSLTAPLLAAVGLAGTDPTGNPGNGLESNRKASARIQSELRLAFERFWPLYPRRDDKAEALEVWMRDVRLEHVDDVVQAAILYAASRQGQDRQYTKQAKRWLAKQRWRSEFENAKEAAVAPPPGRAAPPGSAQAESERNAERRRRIDEEIEKLKRGTDGKPTESGRSTGGTRDVATVDGPVATAR